MTNLISHLPNKFNRKRQKAIFFNKVVSTESQQLKYNANMAMMFKRFQHLYTTARKKRKQPEQ